MKKLLVIITILLVSDSKMFSCGFYPYGEEIRFSLLNPNLFENLGYVDFNYQSNLFGFQTSNNINSKPIIASNILDWYQYCNQKVAIKAILEYNNQLKETDIHPNTDNDFLKYLYTNKKKSVITYLKIAKRCEVITNLEVHDVWERNLTDYKRKEDRLFNLLKLKSKYGEDKFLRRKYQFLSIRLAYYLNKNKQVNDLFTVYFEKTQKDYLYYWSLFFKTMLSNDRDKMLSVVEIFANNKDKSSACYYFFKDEFDLEKTLQLTNDSKRLASIYAFASIQKVDRNIEYINKIYSLDSSSKVLDFLILREVNKLEDWIYTPYYTFFNPSTKYEYEFSTIEVLRSRSEKDRLYAEQLLRFVNNVNMYKVSNPLLWKVCKVQLEFMTRNYKACLSSINLLQKNLTSSKLLLNQLDKIKALALIASQPIKNTQIPKSIEKIILDNQLDYQFIFSIARELEFKHNYSDAFALMSLISDDYVVDWRGNRLLNSGNLKLFYNYFDYLDFVYPTSKMEIIIKKIDEPFGSEFEKKIYKKLIIDKNRLKDLLGTKYVRENNLWRSYFVFKNIDEQYWKTNYNSWERGVYGEQYELKANPFYSLKYTKEFVFPRKSERLTKLSIIKKLIGLKKLINKSSNKHKDYYCFLIANAYYNMSQYGNSWQMRRFKTESDWYDSSTYINESYIDESEYRNNKLAVLYYRKAYEFSKSDKFKALCLRMMDYVQFQIYTESPRVKLNYPQYINELSGCDNLKLFFNAR